MHAVETITAHKVYKALFGISQYSILCHIYNLYKKKYICWYYTKMHLTHLYDYYSNLLNISLSIVWHISPHIILSIKTIQSKALKGIQNVFNTKIKTWTSQKLGWNLGTIYRSCLCGNCISGRTKTCLSICVKYWSCSKIIVHFAVTKKNIPWRNLHEFH